jgi:hypothetical protein
MSVPSDSKCTCTSLISQIIQSVHDEASCPPELKASFTPRELNMEWMKLNFASSSKWHTYIFTENGVIHTPENSKSYE